MEIGLFSASRNEFLLNIRKEKQNEIEPFESYRDESYCNASVSDKVFSTETDGKSE
jgi:hypothetical protein